MQIETHGQHIEVTPALRDYVENRFSRLGRHFEHPCQIRVQLGLDKPQHRAEATVTMTGRSLLPLLRGEVEYFFRRQATRQAYRFLQTVKRVDLIIDDATDLQSKTVGPKVYRGNEISHLQSFWREWHGAQAADSSIRTPDALRQEILPPMHHERPGRRPRWAAARHDAQAKLLHN